jgi:methionine-rich copper-binding protein CopC
VPVHTRLPHRSSRLRTRTRLNVESLEARSLPSSTGWPGLHNPLFEVQPNDTLDLAQSLGNLSVARQGQVVGVIGNGPAKAADVDWYSFTLTSASTVSLTTFDPNGGPFPAVISLYNNAVDVFDQYNPTGHRLLAQEEGATASVQQLLSPGTYFVAISGAGNRYFYPFLADSGTDGHTGSYALVVTATAFASSSTNPQVLSADPADGAVLNDSPFELYLTFNQQVDFSTIAPGVNVTLTYNPTGDFGDGNDQDVPLQATFSQSADELQLMPISALTSSQQPLAPGYYRLLLTRDSSAIPLDGDYTATFQINGIKGRTGPGALADDTAATAQDLGNVTAKGLVQAEGAIGDDPAYNPANPNPLLANPAADVDMYHFQITGPGNYALTAQVSAGSIGYWTFDPALTLFKEDSGQLQVVAVNEGTLNDTTATDGTLPLYDDAVIFAGLRAGDYYVAVSSSGNMPFPAQGIEPGTNGVFDPTVSHSGTNGYTTGPYLLSLIVSPDGDPPVVTNISLENGAVLNAAPTQFTVGFSEGVNLQQLAYNQSLLTSSGEIAPVFIQGANGVDYYPRLLSYDAETNQAVFQMLDRLPNGSAELHLSGGLGLQDLAGNPLVGSDPADPSSDYVVSFTVNGPVPGSPGNPLLWLDQEPNDTLAQPQHLGVLFPQELQDGVTISRDFTTAPASAPSDTADYYQLEVLQSRGYFFILNGSGLPPGTQPQLFTADGDPVFTTGGAVNLADLTAGSYILRVGGWASAQAGSVKYDLRITLSGSDENPTPLTVGPAPAYRLQLAQSIGAGGNPGGPGSNGTNVSNGGPGVLPPVPAVVISLPPAQGEPGSVVLVGHTTATPAASTGSELLANALSLFSALPIGGLRGTTGTSPGSPDRLVLNGSYMNQLALLSSLLLHSGSDEVLPLDRFPEDPDGGLFGLATPWKQMERFQQLILDYLFCSPTMPGWSADDVEGQDDLLSPLT